MEKFAVRGALLLGAALSLATWQSRALSSPGDMARYADASDGKDWPGYGRTFGEQHYSPLTQINAANVASLGLAWFDDLPGNNTATVPVEVGGVLYIAYGLTVIRAYDVRSGRMLWEYDSHTGEKAGARLRQGWGIRGLAYWNGKVYAGTGDGRLVAVDAASGKEVWAVSTVEEGDFRYITGAPRVFGGKIIIGHGGADSASIRGYVTTYDAETGKELWRFYLAPGDPAKGFEDKAQAMAARTWKGEWWKYGGGANAWNDFTYDAETDTILIGTGNGAPWNQKIRSPGGGDNLFVCSMVALDAKTGAYKWHYQYNPGETWDYNATMDMELADLKIDGHMRKVVLTAPKNGFFYVIDRTDGKLISAEKIARVTWATRIDVASGRPVEVAAARFPDGRPFELWPSFRGAHSWMPMAFSPRTGLAYVPKLESGAIYADKGITPANWTRTPGNAVDMAIDLDFNVKDPLQNTSSLLAWNPVTQKKAWEVSTIGGWNGGVMATGGNLVFQGQLNGRFSAYSADKGQELWHFDAQNAVLGAPISYWVDGRQYVTVAVGMGTSVASYRAALGGLDFDYRTQKRRLLTFVLGGTARLPAADRPTRLQAVDDPGFRRDDALAMQGAAVFGRRCVECHGVGMIAAGGAPDLRTSGIPLDAGLFRQVVHDGMLAPNGMPRFDNLTDADLAAVRQYIRTGADDLRQGKPEGAAAGVH
jgi:quinohemoprotein ethanol dehydrogenase